MKIKEEKSSPNKELTKFDLINLGLPPRLSELICILWKICPSYFKNFYCEIQSNNLAVKRIGNIYASALDRLDEISWENVKTELTKKIFDPIRGQQSVLSLLNEVVAYNYLIELGCKEVNFILEQKKKTPDLQGCINEDSLFLCEVKTLHISDDKINIEKKECVENSSEEINENFWYNKLKPTLCQARSQLQSYCSLDKFKNKGVRKIIFVVINFDDFFAEYADTYFRQIDRWLSVDKFPDVEIIFSCYLFFQLSISMKEAKFINLVR